MDVTDGLSVREAVRRVSARVHHVDVLINNAGVLHRGEPSVDALDFSRLEDGYRVNALGALRVTAAFLPLLQKGTGKRIVSVSSLMGSIEDDASGGSYGYRMSKAALNIATKNLAVELADDGFVVVAIHPGWVRTRMGGERAPLEIERAVRDLIATALSAGPDRSGGFYGPGGTRLNNHYAANADEQWSTYTVGYGITPQPKAGSPALNKLYADQWQDWERQCSADGLPHFGAIQRLLAKSEFESGEVLIRRRFRRRSDGMPIPLQLQVIEPDYLDHSKTSGLSDGGYIIQGVEFNSIGRRVAYWLYPQHPGEVTTTTNRPLGSERIDASEIIHLYDMRRPGMVRGVPRLAPVLLRMRDLDDYEDAYLMLQKTQACLAGFVEQPEADSLPMNRSRTDSIGGGDYVRLEMIEPATINYLKPGERVTFSNPRITEAYGEYKRSIVRDLACGIGYPYEILFGDSSQSNYSSSRGGKVGFIQLIETYRWDVLIPASDRIWDW